MMGLVIGWGSSLKSAKITFINDTLKYRYPVVINKIKLKNTEGFTTLDFIRDIYNISIGWNHQIPQQQPRTAASY